MVKNSLRLTILVAVLVLCGRSASATPLTWTILIDPPGGSITGAPGTSVGWGYTITNQDPTYALVLTGLAAVPTQGFSNGTTGHSVTSADIFDFPTLAPGASLFVPFIADLQGLFQFNWDVGAPLGVVNFGVFSLSAEFWESDLSAIFQSAASLQQPYSVTSVTAVPEPGTLMLLGFGLCAGAVARRRSVKNAQKLCVLR